MGLFNSNTHQNAYSYMIQDSVYFEWRNWNGGRGRRTDMWKIGSDNRKVTYDYVHREGTGGIAWSSSSLLIEMSEWLTVIVQALESTSVDCGQKGCPRYHRHTSPETLLSNLLSTAAHDCSRMRRDWISTKVTEWPAFSRALMNALKVLPETRLEEYWSSFSSGNRST